MYIEKFMSKYQKKNPEKFNEDLINAKSQEDIVQLMSEACKSLEIIDGIKFLGCTYSKMNKIYKSPKKKIEVKNNEATSDFDIEESRLALITIKFQIQKDDETATVTKELYFPELIDNKYFLINGNRFFPIFQLTDAETYRTKNSITLKTLMMPDIIRYENVTLEADNCEATFNTRILTLDLFKNKIYIFLYYFAKMGVPKTLEYFGLENIVSLDNELNNSSNVYSFQISKELFINVDKEWMDEDPKQNSIIIATLMMTMNGRITLDKVYEIEYWQRKLGSNFTKNNSNHLEKGVSILSSFERILDETTKRILRIDDIHKQDSYSIVRWIVMNYESLLRQDNMDLANKRLRLYEYLMYPLVRKFSKSVYRILNQKVVTIKSLKNSLNSIKKGFLIKEIVNNKLVRYMNNVNTIDLFSNVLKCSINGPQSSGGSGGVSVRMRAVHESMIGRIDCCSTSSGSPGESLTITPFCILTDDLHFTEEPKIKYKKYENDDEDDDYDETTFEGNDNVED